jgi:hypothetical protein
MIVIIEIIAPFPTHTLGRWVNIFIKVIGTFHHGIAVLVNVDIF